MAGKEEVNLHLTAKDDATKVVSALDKRLDGLTDEDRVAILRADATAAQREIDGLTRKLADAARYDDETIALFVEARGNAQQRLDAVQSELRSIDGSTVEAVVEADTSQAEAGIDGLIAKLSGIDGPIGDVGGKLGKLASPGGAVAALGAGLLLAGQHAADMAIEAGDLARLTGDSTEAASRLNAVWKQGGFDAKDLQDVLLQMQGVLADDAELAASLGVNLNDGKGIGERFVEVVGKVGEQFDDAGDRAVVMSKLFGEEGVRQVNSVVASVGDLGAAIEDVPAGQVISEEEVERAREAKAQMVEMKAEMSAFAATVGQEVLPMLTAMFETLNSIGTVVGSIGGALSENFWGPDVDHQAALDAAIDKAGVLTGKLQEMTPVIESAAAALADDMATAMEEAASATKLNAEAYEEAADAARNYSSADIAARDAAQEALDEWNEAAHEAFEADQQRAEDAISKRQEDINAWREWRDSINEATDSGEASLGDFVESAETSFEEWRDELAKSILAQATWKDNLAQIGSDTSAEFAAALGDMGLAGAGLVAEIANDSGKLDEAYGLWLESTRQAGRDLVGEIESIEAGAGASAADVGAAISSGISAGIRKNIGAVLSAVESVTSAAVAKARSALQIASPSMPDTEVVGPAMRLNMAGGDE